MAGFTWCSSLWSSGTDSIMAGVSFPSGLGTAMTLWPVPSMAPVSWTLTWPVWAEITAS